MIGKMAASDFIRYFKSAKMLQAENRMINIESISFPHYSSQDDREKVMRNLTSASKQFLWEPMKDFAEVAANFAKRLKNG